MQHECAATESGGLRLDEPEHGLSEARLAARARPVEAKLTRGDEGYTGTLVVAIGSRP